MSEKLKFETILNVAISDTTLDNVLEENSCVDCHDCDYNCEECDNCDCDSNN